MSLPLAATAEEFSPEHEFELPAWIPIELGPLDLSVNKAVAYLWLSGLLTILLGIWLMRFGLSLRPSRRQTTGESLYDLLQAQIAEGNLPRKSVGRWFPYVASLFLFIWVMNLVGFVPLPLSDETFDLFGAEVPTWGVYAATANL
ncbi:MAG TPA: F0F1 ATP synthase subunit A, partial [Thermoleophilaceae bacterium]|nr:F0F1 ATP synthase subunit A [Thermoleophilaceae bacterium]